MAMKSCLKRYGGGHYKTDTVISTYGHIATVQYSTIQYNTIQYSTVQYSTVQYSTVQYSTVQYSTVQYSMSLACPLILVLKESKYTSCNEST